MLRACGITAQWANRASSSEASRPNHTTTPMTASIKTQPEDFVVVELDTAGQRTDAVDYVFYQPLSTRTELGEAAEETELTEIVDAEGMEGVTGVAGAQEVGASHPANENAEEVEVSVGAWLSAMMTSLRSQLVERHCSRDEVCAAAARLSVSELGTLAESLRARAPDAETKAATVDGQHLPIWDVVCPLDTNLDPAHRRLLHFAIRFGYTHLRARGQPRAGGLENVVAVVDGHYIFIARLLGQQVAEVLAQWAQCEATSATARMSTEELHALETVLTDMGKPCGRSEPSVTTIYTAFPTSLNLDDGSDIEDDSGATLSDKDARRVFHEVLRRFYPYVRCSVSSGRIRLSWEGAKASSRGKGGRRYGSESTAGPQKRSRSRDKLGCEQRVTEARTEGENEAARSSVYTYCVVKKRNLDTMEMKTLLASAFGVREGAVCMAGMKDKRAVTYQRVSIPARGSSTSGSATVTTSTARIPWPSDPLESYVEILHRASVAAPVGGPKLNGSATALLPFTAPVQLGELKGNRFRVTLRDIKYGSATSDTQSAAKEEGESLSSSAAIATSASAAVAEDLTARFERVARGGFTNFFGQQRFSQSAVDLLDHTGLHLFAGRYVAAVRSIFRACPDVYDDFPERMDSRYAPRNSRDCQVVAHALRETYRRHFSGQPLTRQDVEGESALWQLICERAVCSFTPYALRSIWVHAGQSLFFNVAASFAADALTQRYNTAQGAAEAAAVERLAQRLYLPTAGYRAGVNTSGTNSKGDSSAQRRAESPEEAAELMQLAAAAEAHALTTLQLRRKDALGQKRVAGVPVPGSWRSFIVRPADATVEVVASHSESGSSVKEAVLAFTLPPSSYATVCLSAVLCNEEWW